jgi:uroporphyrinogen-III synthase
VARVLVTRPQPGATRTATRLNAAGWEPLVIPLSAIVPVPAELPAGDFMAVAASSANALRHAPAELLAPLLDKPLFAVGDETAAAAREAGFHDVRSGSAAAAELARDVAAAVPAGRRIAYLCGRVRLPELEAKLAAGNDLAAIETYDTLARNPSPADLAVLDEEPVAAALVYSARAADGLARLEGRRASLSGTLFISISARVADRLATVASGKVLVAANPDEDAMFDLLARIGHEPAPIAGKFD